MKLGQEFRSNRGRGPLRAKIVEWVGDDRVRMFYWHEKRSDARRVYFTQTKRYMESPRCGWKAVMGRRTVSA